MKNSALFVLCALLTACGGSDDNKTTNQTTIQSYTITTNVEGEGQVQPTSLVLKQGESGTFELKSEQGYQVASVEGCNGTYSDNNYTIENATQSCQVTAKFEAKTINVALKSDAYITLSTDKDDYVYGDSAVISYELSPGYLLAEITGCNGALNGELYKVDALTADCQITATTLPTSQLFSGEDEAKVNVTVLDGKGGFLPSSKGIIEPSNSELPPLNNSLEFERDLLAVDIATEAGQTIELQITYETPLPTQFTYQKLIEQQWQALDQANVTVSEDRLTLTLALTDGGAGDSDGLVNGIIKDPGGPAVVKMHTVTINQSAGGAITPESLAVAHGDTALFTISTDAGYTLESVTGCNGTLNGTSYQTAAITQNCEISAEFSLRSFLVTAQAGEGGQISPLEQLASYGNTLTFTVTSDDDHNIESVQGCNGSLAGNIYTTGILTAGCEVRASFDPQKVIVTAQSGAGGSISPMSQELNVGQQANLIVSPNEGYSIANVIGCSGSLSGNTYTTGVVTANCQVQASFSIDSYTVSASAGEGGTVNPATQNVNHGSRAQITITPNSGYNIDTVTGCNGTLSGNTYTTSAITANCQVQASFSIDSYTVSASASEGGTVTPTTQSVNHGSSAKIIITPNSGYNIDAVTGCSGSLNGNTYTTSAITANCQVQASFSINNYTVTASAGEGGAVTPTTQSVNHGSSAQITITPNEGYSIDTVTGCNGTLSGNTYTTSAVTANCQVQASFSIDSYTVSASAGEGGTVNPATQNVNHGSRAQITITPNSGYNIDAVTGCSGSLNGNTYTTSAITANCQVQASFSINSYTVSASTGEGGTVNPTTQSVNHGSSAQIMITPNEGYSIDTVTGCNGSLNDNIYTTDAVTANCEVQASFGATHYKVKQSGFNDYQLQISIDGQDWFDFTADTNLPLTNGIGQEVFYMLVDGQLFTLTCNIENCIVTPYTLLVNYLSQAFSENSSTQAGSLLDETLGLQIDPFVKDSTTFNTVRFNSWVTDSSLFNVIATITGDVLDGYVDEQRVIALSTNAKQRAIEEIIVEVGELPEASEGETLQIYSISTESSSQQQGETKGYLSDYVMQTEFVDPDTQEVTKDIVYLSFNTGRWKGKLNAETHTFSSLFIGTPEWLFLPEAEKVKIAENLENNPLFKEAVATYQSVIVDVNSLKLIKYNQLLEQIQLTAPTLRESQLQVLQQSIASQVNQNNAQIIPQNVIKSQQLQNNAISCEAKVENRVLVSGILLDQLKIGMNRTCDQTTLASRMAVWYAWGKKNKLTKDQSFWDELNNTQMVAPKNFTDIKAKGSNINDLENGLTYTLYKKHPHKFVSKPMVYNTARAATLIIKVVFGAQPALGDKFPKKLKEVADTAKAAKEKLENYLIFAEGALAGSQLIVEIIEPLLKEENKNSEFYVESKKILRNAQKAVTDISSLLGAIATPDEVAVLDFKDEYEKIKRTLGSKHAGKLKKHTHLTVKNALVFTMLRVFSDDNGDIQFGKTKVPAKAIALRLALYDLQSLVGKANIGKRAKLKSLLKKLGVADEKTYVAVMQLSPDSISTAIIAKASTKEFRNDILKLINVDPDNLAKTVTETLKSLASETFQNKDEVLKTVIWALVDGFINNASTNVVPALIKSMGPQKYAQLILSGAEIGAFAVDLAIKPDYLNFKTKACDENSAQTCFEVAAPPLEVLPYIVAVDTPNDSQRKNGVYVLDSSAWLSAQSEHDEHSWPDDTVDYLAAMPIRNNHESAMLVLSGAALSYEIDAFVAPHQFKDFESFISLMESDKRSLNFDWFVYPYKNSEWPNIVGTQLPVRSRGNSLASNNYKPIAIDAGEYDCDLQSGWLKCKDVFLRAKSSNLRNPVLTQFIKQQIAANTQQDKEYQVDLDNLAFLSFTKATKKVGWDEYATFTSPGIRNISSHMELGDAKWETDVDIYVIPDYLKQDSEHISHLEAFIGQSAIEINKQGEVIGLNARLRRADNFNYFGEQKEQTYRIDNQFFYPVIKAYNSQTKQTVYFKGEPILLNRVDGQSISLKQLPQGYQAQKVYIYDSVFANYLENVGGSFVTWLERRAGRIHYFVNSAKDPSRQVAKGEFAGLPYLIVDLNTTTMKRVTVQDELTALQDSDGDDVPDELDTYPDDMRYAFDSDLDGMADKWEEAYGFNPFNSESMNNQGPNDDYDDDSFSNLVEFAKTLELSKDYSGYNPTIKTAQWKSDSQKVKQQNSQPIEVSLNDWLILYQDQVAQSISIEVGNSFTDELPIIELTADKQQIEISLPESWPEQQIKTVKLVLKLNTGELAVSDKPLNEGGAQGDLVEYLSLFLSKDMQGDNWVLGVEFTDTYFAQCVQAHVDAQQVTRLADLTTLDCSNKGITSIAELSYMTGLTSLNLVDNKLTTINLDDNLALNSADLRGNQFDQATLDYLVIINWIAELNFDRHATPQGELTVQANDEFVISDSGKTDIAEPIMAKYVFDNVLYQGTANGKLIVSNYLDKTTTRYLIELDEFERLNTQVSFIQVDATYIYVGILAQRENGIYQARLLVFENGELSHPTKMLWNILLDESSTDGRLRFDKGAILFNEQLIVLLNGRVLKLDYINGEFLNPNATWIYGGTSDICRVGERIYARVNGLLSELELSGGSFTVSKTSSWIRHLDCYGEYIFTDLGIFNTELEPLSEMLDNGQAAYYQINGEVQNNTARFSNGQCILQVEAFDILTIAKRSEVLKSFDANTSSQCGRFRNKRLYQYGDEFIFDYDLGLIVSTELINVDVLGARGFVRATSKVDEKTIIVAYDRSVDLVDLETKKLTQVISLVEESMNESRSILNLDFNLGNLILDHNLDNRNSHSFLERYNLNEAGGFEHVSSKNMGHRYRKSYFCANNIAAESNAVANGLPYRAVTIYNEIGKVIHSGGYRDVHCAGEDIYLFSPSNTTKYVYKLTQNAEGNYEVVKALDEYLRDYSVLSFDNKILINHLSSQENLIVTERDGIQPAVMGVDAPLEVDYDFIRSFSSAGDLLEEIPYNPSSRPSKELILDSGLALLANTQIYFYPLTLYSGSPRVANGFDYPISNRGLDTDAKAISFNEQLPEELNHSYSQDWVNDNHTRFVSTASGWRNAQDVGSFYSQLGGVHPGEDWNIGSGSDDAGEQVYAIANGKVTHLQSTYQSGHQTGGYTMIIEHTLADGSKVHSVYTHITAPAQTDGTLSENTQEFSVQIGDVVSRGQVIARLAKGMTALSPHLHFELRTIAPGSDLYPHDNGNGYYSHDKGKHSSLTAEQINSAFTIMKEDEGLIDPSDFIDFNRSGVTGVVTSIETNQPTKLGEEFTLTIKGNNLPSTIAAAVHDASCEAIYAVTAQSAKLDCTPNNSGELFVYIKQQSGGVYLHGSQDLWLSVAASSNNVLGIEFADTRFAQCVQAHVDTQQVTRLADLTTLNCSNKGIASVAELSHMTGLTSLNLANNSLTTINLDDNLALNSADLRGNQFDQATLDYLAVITRIADLKYLNTPPPTTTTGKLNDTGITWCADGSNNNLDCPVTGYEGQDAEYGRDAQAKVGTLQKVGGGNGGFDFTKLDANGNDLPESASMWSCVRDNHTGLIWEVKTDDGGLHDKNDSFNWYNPDSNTNGGHPGFQDDDGDICYGYDANNEASYCNTHAYVERVNTQSLCGVNDWRLPNVQELRSIVDYGSSNPAIDTGYFLHTAGSSTYWTSSQFADFTYNSAWNVIFYGGNNSNSQRDVSYIHVRLVRGGQ